MNAHGTSGALVSGPAPKWARLPDIATADVSGRTVLVRANLDTALTDGRPVDDAAIRHFAPTVRDLVARGARVVVMTHLGDPRGEPNPLLSTRPLAVALALELGQDVIFVRECAGDIAERAIARIEPGQVAMLENLRFHPGETANDRSFAMLLSVNGDIYLNDAASLACAPCASRDAIAALMPAYAGPSLRASAATRTPHLRQEI
jgi:phosphoglycerate kinase